MKIWKIHIKQLLESNLFPQISNFVEMWGFMQNMDIRRCLSRYTYGIWEIFVLLIIIPVISTLCATNTMINLQNKYVSNLFVFLLGLLIFDLGMLIMRRIKMGRFVKIIIELDQICKATTYKHLYNIMPGAGDSIRNGFNEILGEIARHILKSESIDPENECLENLRGQSKRTREIACMFGFKIDSSKIIFAKEEAKSGGT